MAVTPFEKRGQVISVTFWSENRGKNEGSPPLTVISFVPGKKRREFLCLWEMEARLSHLG